MWHVTHKLMWQLFKGEREARHDPGGPVHEVSPLVQATRRISFHISKSGYIATFNGKIVFGGDPE